MLSLRLLVLLILLWCIHCEEEAAAAEVGGKEEEEESAEEDDEARNYLYLPMGADAGPVIEYQPKEGEDPDKPDFIYGPNNGPRVVEFYAVWCPHCQHFKHHYVHFAEQLQILTSSQPGQADVKIYAVSCTMYRQLCRDFGVDSYPGLKVFKAGATNATSEAKYWQFHPFDVLKDLGLQAASLNLELPTLDKKKNTDKSRPDSVVDLRNVRSKQNVFDDAWLSLDFALKNGVFMDNADTLGNKTQTRLKDWLDLLHLVLPPSWQIQNLIQALLDNFQDIVKSENEMNSVLSKYPPPMKKWSPSCTHGDPAAGYTCGLWELFHLVTVGVVEYNLMISTDDGGLVVQTEDAAVKIRNFVESFFGCEVCRINFVSTFDRCAFDRCNRLSLAAFKDLEWIQLPVWLWETHNAVNVRLLREKGIRENWQPAPKDEIDRQWPSRGTCPKCWDDRGGWDDETVYKYLRVEYWPEDPVTEQYREELSNQDPLDDEKEPTMGKGVTPLLLSLLFFGIGGGAGWYTRRQQRWLSGRHKKTDESYGSNGYIKYSSRV